jgi:hypothetical protein
MNNSTIGVHVVGLGENRSSQNTSVLIFMKRNLRR